MSRYRTGMTPPVRRLNFMRANLPSSIFTSMETCQGQAVGGTKPDSGPKRRPQASDMLYNGGSNSSLEI